MTRTIVCTAALLALAGCGGSADEPKGNMTAAEVADEVGAVMLKPGQWEVTNEIVSATAKGLPAEALKAMTDQKTTVRNCVTPEQAAKPQGDFLTAQKDANCTYQDWSMDGGRMRGTMTCAGGEGGAGKVVMKMDGAYAPENYDLTMDMETSGGEGMTMAFKARVNGKRIGDCP
ncbi:DUF3617 domain-containing protein [Sphingomonas sp. LY54]|uniref:DUF3617 domain-containing protein n=1 Tax=Sphingomonas sp. LY54 TaxID=3095343 RepID=UPI002D794D33|nr:DUF3617 domain-containing protein [Sphingomonas sp. LY54]WRP29687.1 DUF3617 domain-containing protein [Sphingomonas sp. LY54]